MAELSLHSDSVSDIARALIQDRADAEATEVLAWAESLRACIRSHQREIELLLPWAALLVNEATPTPCSANLRPFSGTKHSKFIVSRCRPWLRCPIDASRRPAS